MHKHRYSTKALYLLMFFVIFFYPTSIDGIILQSSNYYYLYYGICIFIVIWYGSSKLIRKTIIIELIVILSYMLFASIISSRILGGSVEVVRFIYIFLPLVVFTSNPDKILSSKFVLIINEILTIIILLWNFLLIINFEFIQKLTINNYSQFNWFTTKVFVERSRPIFTFGIYSYGAFFYAMLFIFWIYVLTIKYQNNERLKFRYYIYAFSFIVFLILMGGSTSLFLSILMIIFLLTRVGINVKSLMVVPILIALSAYFIYIQDFDWTRIIIGTSSNGFASRYLSTWFQNNFIAVKETMLGIGFTIPSKLNLVYSDSGFIVLFTMGNILLPIFMYSNLFKSYKKNLPKDIFGICLTVILFFEIALPGLLYPKLIIFIAYFYMSVQAVTESND